MPVKEYQICDGLKWIELWDPLSSEMDSISNEYKLNHHLVRDCLEPDHLPKYDFVDGVHFLILRFFSHSFDRKIVGSVQHITDKIAIFYTNDLLITISKDQIPFIETLRRKFVEPGKCSSVEEVVTKIISGSIYSFSDPVQRLSEQIDFYESQIILRNIDNGNIEALYFIKQKVSIINRTLMLMKEPISHIHTIPQDDPALQDIYDQHLKMQTLYSQALEDINNLMNLYMSISAKRTNDVVKVLTIFSVFFMPLTFIVGIYGMNFQFMPELDEPWGYAAVWLIMIAVTVAIFIWFKKKKWL